MYIPLFSNPVKRVGIDLGSSFIRIWSDKDGFVFEEPSLLAVDSKTNKVLAVGKDADEMRGRVSKTIIIHSPIKKGRIYDMSTARAMLQACLRRVMNTTFFSPLVMASVPAGSSVADRQATTKLMLSLGAREAYTISQPLSAAIGSGVPIADASGSFIFQLGSEVVEGAIISLGSLVKKVTKYRGGFYADKQIKQIVMKEKKLLISEQTSEFLKKKLGTVDAGKNSTLLTTGQDIKLLSPTELVVESGVMQPVLEDLAQSYVLQLKSLLSTIPPQLTVDVIDKGLLLSGGFAQLDGLDKYLIESLGVSVSLVDKPEQAVIQGIATTLQHLELFKESLGYQV